MDAELDLTPEQFARIEQALKQSQERTKKIREKIAPEMREELKKVWRAFGVRPQRDDLEHSGRFVLVDPEGLQRVSFPIDQATPERLAHDLRLLAGGA